MPLTDKFPYHAHVPEHVLFEELDGEAILLDLPTEQYAGLDEVGTHMWQVLTGAPTIQDAYHTLLQEYDVPPERLQKDLNRFLDELVDEGLIQLTTQESA